jgi:hypothetical protein
MSPRHACVVWFRRVSETEWDTDGLPLGEREACKSAEELRNFGFVAKALPLGTKPKPVEVKP